MDDLIASIKKLLEETDPSITVQERIIPPKHDDDNDDEPEIIPPSPKHVQ